MFKQKQKPSDGVKENVKVNKFDVEGNSDYITIFIGFSIMFLGTLTILVDIPEEFAIGATIGALFFALSDYVLLGRYLVKADLILNQILIFFGVVGFFLLPVILISVPVLFESIIELSDFATFMALGLAVSALGVKSRNHKREYVREMKNSLRELKEVNEEGVKLRKEYTEEIKKMRECIVEKDLIIRSYEERFNLVMDKEKVG